jgi:hypothetical protein
MSTHETIELPIARKLVDTILARGFSISVNDGEETVLIRSKNKAEILEAMASTDHDWLYVFDGNDHRLGAIMIVWGNGTDIITDWVGTDLMDQLCKPATELAEKL